MIADRVKETTSTTGTGSLTLAGPTAQFQSFNTAFGTGVSFYYVITDANGTDWEVGTGSLSDATTLVRTTVHQSSNADAKINLSAGTHTVFNAAPEVFLSGLAPKSGKLSQFAATTSAELAGVISDETGSGSLVFATSPALTTPSLGVATATSVNGTTIPSSKTLVVTTDKLSALAATTSAELAGVISDETGTGSLVFATSPTLVTPNIGAATATTVNSTTIPSSKTLVVTTDKLSALAATTSAELAGVISDETGSGSLVFATSPSLTTPNIGAATATSVNGTTIPTSKTLVVTTDKLSALAATTSAELAGVISDETGSGSLVFATSPALTTPNLGTPSAGTLSNCTGLPVGGVSGLGTGVATALAVNTGSSGAFVVNGGALGTPSSGTVTNLTGTASININGTVGATTPAAGTFTTLQANGNTTLGDASGDTLTINGTAVSTPNNLNFDSNTLYIDATNNNVGIGTSSPSYRLSVKQSGNTSTASLGITSSNSANDTFIGFGYDATSDTNRIFSSYVSTGAYKPITFWTTDTERMRIDSSGNVGIGTSSPGYKLAVEGSLNNYFGQRIYNSNAGSSAVAYLQIGNDTNGATAQLGLNSAANTTNFGGGNGLYLANGLSAPIAFATSGSERMRIDSSGNVGIGTSSPSNRLHVKQSADNSAAGLGARIERNSNDSILLIGYRDSTDTWQYNATYTSTGAFKPLTFHTSDAERMRIDSSGNVGIGTASPYNLSGYGGLSLNGSSGSIFSLFRNGTKEARLQIASDGLSAITDGAFPIMFKPNDTERMRITSDGELLIGTTADNGAYLLQVNSQIYATNATIATSDSRLKENVVPLTNALDTIKRLTPVAFDFKQDTSYNFDKERQTGFIAQDLQVALEGEEYAESVVKECGQYLGVAYEKLIPLLTKAIQEQQAQIEALKAEVAALKG